MVVPLTVSSMLHRWAGSASRTSLSRCSYSSANCSSFPGVDGACVARRQSEGRRAANSRSLALLQHSNQKIQPSHAKARRAEATGGLISAHATDGEAADVTGGEGLTLTGLHRQFSHMLHALPRAYTDQQRHQQQQPVRPPVRTLEPCDTAALVAAALPVASELLSLLKNTQVTEKQLHLHATENRASGGRLSSGSRNRQAGDGDKRLLGECLDALARLVGAAGCAAAAATQGTAPGKATAPSVAAAKGTTDAAHVQAARGAVLLLQCLLHAERHRWLSRSCLLLPHMQSAAECLAASAAAQLHLQQLHNKEQLQVQGTYTPWLWHQQTELAVLLKRSTRLLGALLSNPIGTLQQQSDQRECHSAGSEASLNPLHFDAPAMAHPSTEATIAATNLLAIQRLLDAAVRLVQFSQQPDAAPSVDTPASSFVAATENVGGKPPAEKRPTFTAAPELRHLPPLLLWLVPSLCSAKGRVSVTSCRYTPWVAATRLAEKQQEQLQHLQLADLSLLLLATARILALQQQSQQQQQHQAPVAADRPSAATAACRQQLRRLACGCALRAAKLLSSEGGVETPQTQAAIKTRSRVTTPDLEVQIQQQQEHQSQQAHQKQQQWRHSWLRQCCIMLLALTRLLQQEQLVVPGVVRHPCVQQALVSTYTNSSDSGHSSDDTSCHSTYMSHWYSGSNAALAAAAVTFMTAFERCLTSAEWVPPPLRQKQDWPHQLQQLQQQEHEQEQQQPPATTASSVVGIIRSSTLLNSSPIAAGTRTTNAAAAAGPAGRGQGEQVFMPGRDFAQLLHCFVSLRFLPASLLQKSLAFIAAYPPIVGLRHHQRRNPSPTAVKIDAPSLLLSPQDAGLLLWTLGVACASGLSQRLQWQCSRGVSAPGSAVSPPLRRKPLVSCKSAVTAETRFSTAEGLQLSAAAQLAVRRQLRKVAVQLLQDAAPNEPATGDGITVEDSSRRESKTSCRPDTQAVANAVWGLACCGLLQPRLLRAAAALPSFRHWFSRCCNSAEKMQFLRALLLQRLQRARAPAATAGFTTAAHIIHRGPRWLFSACRGTLRQAHFKRKAKILAIRKNPKHHRHFQRQGQLQQQQPQPHYPYQQKRRQWKHERKSSGRLGCNAGEACSVRPSLLQQEVLREVQHLLQEPLSSSLAQRVATATAHAARIALLHECIVWPGLYVDIAIVGQRQGKPQPPYHKKHRVSSGRVRTGSHPIRIAIEVDGPSHFVLSTHTRGGEGTNNTQGWQGSSSHRSTDLVSDCSRPDKTISSKCVTLELRADGGTALKHRLLRLLGWRVIHIGFAEWQQLQGRRDLQQQLLQRHAELRQVFRWEHSALKQFLCGNTSKSGTQQEGRPKVQQAEP